MAEITNRQIADFLEEFGVLLELNGANPFQVRAYGRAARIIERLDREVADLVARQELTQIKGIGKGLAGLIAECAQTGTAEEFESLRSALPPGLFDMLRISGLGPKKIRAVHQKLNIDTLERLEQACRQGTLSALSGFGQKTQANILKGIEQLRRYQGQYLVDAAWSQAEPLWVFLTDHPQVTRASVAGSLRRCCELVDRIDLVAATASPDQVADAFAAHPSVAEVVTRDADGLSVRLETGLPATLYLTADASFPAVMLHHTGSATHIEQLRDRARERGLKLDKGGLQRDEKRVACTSEADLFAALDLPCIPPELREGTGEIDAAARGEIPALVELADIRGMLHVHTTYSDGLESLEAMAQAVSRRGYAYLGVADHSRSAGYAGGLSPDDVRRQHDEIDALNQRSPDFRLFKGIESDILGDGSLDYDDTLLETFDFIVISVHSRFRMAQDEMTRRLIRAIEHPASSILGHLTGRLLLQREGYELDVDAVLEAAARCRVAVEINSHPHRLDIDWRHLRKARELGVKMAINTDAHRIDGLDHLTYGLGVARKGWLGATDIINTFDAEDLATCFCGAV